MFTLSIENENGQKIQLSQNESNYQVTNIDGLNPTKANINTNKVVNMDGAMFKSSKLDMRNIVITLKVKGDIEKNRINLYQIFNVGKKSKLYYSNETRSIWVECYCENIITNLFSQTEEMQISLICPSPFLSNIEKAVSDLSKVVKKFSFPFSLPAEGSVLSGIDLDKTTTILNSGEGETGLIITIYSRGEEVENPIIFNAGTGEAFKLETVLNDSDFIVVNTNKGNKSVIKYSNGTEENLLSKVTPDSVWLQLKQGYQNFTYTTQNKNKDYLLTVSFEYNIVYEGV